ncbi:MAG: hypothetical protein ABJG88_04260 [Litorimonas sp.]
MKSFLGLFAVIGNWPNWESYFDLSRKGLKTSFIVLLFALPAYYIIISAIYVHGAQIQELEREAVPAAPFIIITSIYLLSFSAYAYLLTMITDKQDRFRPWVITRHWAVTGLAWVSAIFLGLYMLGPLPFTLSYGVTVAGYLGLLAIDIRLLHKVAEFKLGAAILLGCIIVAFSLTLVMLGLEQL